MAWVFDVLVTLEKNLSWVPYGCHIVEKLSEVSIGHLMDNVIPKLCMGYLMHATRESQGEASEYFMAVIWVSYCKKVCSI